MKYMLQRFPNLFKREKKQLKGTISLDEIEKFLPDSPTILEAGAHVGSDTVVMAKKWSNSTIYAFEPVPSIYEELLKNTSSYPNVITFPIALGNKNGYQKFYVSGGASDGSSSLLPPKDHLRFHPDVTFDHEITVQLVMLDNWFVDNSLKPIDFMWLDLQGAELMVLQAGEQVLKSVQCIYAEVNLYENYDGAGLYSDLRLWLEHKGFRVQREALGWEDAGNVLFVRS